MIPISLINLCKNKCKYYKIDKTEKKIIKSFRKYFYNVRLTIFAGLIDTHMYMKLESNNDD